MFPTRLFLMLAAEICGASEHDRPLNRTAASRTPIAFLAMMNEVARRVAGVAQLARDYVAEDAPHRREDRFHFDVRKAVDGAAGMYRRLEQRLVRVQISDAGNDFLRHQQRLHRTAARGDERAELAQRERSIERIGSETMIGDECVRIRSDFGDAEEAHVLECQMKFVVEV